MLTPSVMQRPCFVFWITLGGSNGFAADTLGVSGRPSHTFVAKGKIKPKTPAAPVNRKRRKTTSKANLPAKKKKKLARVSIGSDIKTANLAPPT